MGRVSYEAGRGSGWAAGGERVLGGGGLRAHHHQRHGDVTCPGRPSGAGRPEGGRRRHRLCRLPLPLPPPLPLPLPLLLVLVLVLVPSASWGRAGL